MRFSFKSIQEKIVETDKKCKVFLMFLWFLPFGTLWVLIFIIILKQIEKRNRKRLNKSQKNTLVIASKSCH